MIGRLQQVHKGYNFIKLTFTFKDMDAAEQIIEKYYGKDIELDIDIKTFSAKRTKNANAYCWVLCDEISKALHNGETRVDVYRKAIREVGIFRDIDLRADAARTMMKGWEGNGIGWFSEKVDDSEFEGFELIRFYFGSSVYNKKQMARLIDWIVEEAKDQGIEVLTDQELSLLKDGWNGEHIQDKG